jgi:hypothetical protein
MSVSDTNAMDDIEGFGRTIGSKDQEYINAQPRQLSRELDLMADFLLDLYACEKLRIETPDGLTKVPPSVGLK